MLRVVRFALLTAIAASSVWAAKKDLAWKTGKVLDSQAAKAYFQSGATTNGSSDTTAFGSATTYGNTTTASATAHTNSNAETQIHHMAIESTQLVIVGDEYTYLVNDDVEKAVGPPLRGSLGRAIANRKHGCRYIVGDSIQYAQEKSNLWVTDGDGKKCKLEIVRQERLASAATPAKL
ncbi:MAG TPA: hypothetical protein VN633_17710 [Bryobacteraceae bacterium]|nr:hypothetical protein [Bryobacteraceae bacterium]HXR75480.1 hypothetical protein [Bryobacteraceae bacterium]